MKKIFKEFGGLILFYSVLIIGVLLLNLRFSYLNNQNYDTKNYIAMNN